MLAELLRTLQQVPSSELVVQTDRPIQLRSGSHAKDLTRTPTTLEQIEELTTGTPLASLVPSYDVAKETRGFEIDGCAFEATFARFLDDLQIRIVPRPASGRSTHSQPAVRSIPLAREADGIPLVGEADGIPLAAEPDAIPLATEPGAIPLATEPDAIPLAAEPDAIPLARELDAIPLAVEPDAIPLAREPTPPPIVAEPRPAARVPSVPKVPAAPKPVVVHEAQHRPAPRGPSPPPHPRRRTSSLSRPSLRPIAGPALPPVDRPRNEPSEKARAQLTNLLTWARERGASDVHVTSARPAAVRSVGQLLPHGDPLPDALVQSMLLPLLGDRHLRALDERGYADLAVELEGTGRLRLNACRQRTGLKGCFRLIATEPPTLARLGLPEELGRVTQQHQGLVVISGPNGQGKTTTLSALVASLNEAKPIHILTVEDPVEVVHPVRRAVVTQREVGTHTRSFPSALKGALREDPDVIAIGELRDKETVEMALSAAETGHLVLATMSTPSGAKTIDRLIDMFPPDDQQQVRATLAGTLKLVVSQRLVPSADGSRMVAIAELITGNVPLWTLIRDNKLYQLPSLLQRGRAYGMLRFDDSLRAAVEQGLVKLEDAQRLADNPQALQPNAAPAAAGVARPPVAAPAPVEQAVGNKLRAGMGRFFGRKDS